jgi:hypothetical protein
MITADQLTTLTTFTAAALTRSIQLSGYKKDSFLTAEFVGMTNASQFAYRVSYKDDNFKEPQMTKVFLNYDPIGGKVSADY